MPSIKTNKAQQRALDEVTKKLEILYTLSSIEDGTDIVNTAIVFTKGGEGRKKTVKVELTDENAKEMKKLVAMLEDFRKRLIKEIKDKAKKFGISFSEEELLLLDEENHQESDNDEEDVAAPDGQETALDEDAEMVEDADEDFLGADEDDSDEFFSSTGY